MFVIAFVESALLSLRVQIPTTLLAFVAMAFRNLVDDRDLKQILAHKRVAPDGIAYTKQEFQNFYGESLGEYRWSQADVAPDDLADIATSSSSFFQALATEHAFQAPATEPRPAENMLFQAPATEHVASDSSMSSAAAPTLPKSPPPPVASSSSMSSAAEPTLPKRPPLHVASNNSPPPVASSSSVSRAAMAPLPKRPPPPVASDSSPPPVAGSSSRSRAAESPKAQHPLRCPWSGASSSSTSRPNAEPQRFFSPLTEAPQRRLPTVDLTPVDVTQPVVAPVHVQRPTDGDATEHATEPLRLMPEDVRAIQRAERDRGPPRSLHQLARNALNDIEDRDPPIDVSLDNEFPWREYIAAHNESAKIIGTGIVQARAVFLKDQKDPNRGGASRVDFCFVRSDDTVCRVHPGIKRSGDAKLKFAQRAQLSL